MTYKHVFVESCMVLIKWYLKIAAPKSIAKFLEYLGEQEIIALSFHINVI